MSLQPFIENEILAYIKGFSFVSINIGCLIVFVLFSCTVIILAVEFASKKKESSPSAIIIIQL